MTTKKTKISDSYRTKRLKTWAGVAKYFITLTVLLVALKWAPAETKQIISYSVVFVLGGGDEKVKKIVGLLS